MELPVKKGKVLTPISFSNGFFCNNLYCENIRFRLDELNHKIVLSLDFSKEYLKKTSDRYGFDILVSYVNQMRIIDIPDKHTVKTIEEYFKIWDNGDYDGTLVELKIDRVYSFSADFKIGRLNYLRIELQNS